MKMFISYKYKDVKYRNDLNSMALNPNSILTHVPEFERKDLRNKGRDVIKNHLTEKMNGCSVMLCLIGTNTKDSNWVQYEIGVANNWKIPIIPIAISNGPVPVGIRNRTTVKFDAKTIQNAVNQKEKWK
jgi:hypothetical protein